MWQVSAVQACGLTGCRLQGGEESSTEQAQQGLDDNAGAVRTRVRPVRAAAAGHAVPGTFAAHDSDDAGRSYGPSANHSGGMTWYDDEHGCADGGGFQRAPTETIQDCAGVLIRVHSQPCALGGPPADSSLAHAQSVGNFSLTSGESGSDAEGERSLRCPLVSSLPSGHAESPRPTTSHYELAGCVGGGEASGGDAVRGSLPGHFMQGIPSTHAAAPAPAPWCLEWAAAEQHESPKPMHPHLGSSGTGDDVDMVSSPPQMASWPGAFLAEMGPGGLDEPVDTMHADGPSGTLADGFLYGALEETNCGLAPGAFPPIRESAYLGALEPQFLEVLLPALRAASARRWFGRVQILTPTFCWQTWTTWRRTSGSMRRRQPGTARSRRAGTRP